MTELDMQARDLAWIEHRSRVISLKHLNTTKARFWKALTEDAREGWRQMARRFCFFLHRLNDDSLNNAHILGDFGTGA